MSVHVKPHKPIVSATTDQAQQQDGAGDVAMQDAAVAAGEVAAAQQPVGLDVAALVAFRDKLPVHASPMPRKLLPKPAKGA